jgi:restriction endonuclease S subunit
MGKVFLKEVATVFFGILEKTEKEAEGALWITASNLLPNNTFAGYDYGLPFAAVDSLSVKSGDILVRRISPGYINYLQEAAPNCYAANNLIIIRTNEKVDSKYLAYLLDQNISKIIKKAAKGTTLPTLTRQNLDEFEVEMLSLNAQRKVGNLWFLNIEKTKLHKRIVELESKKLHYLLGRVYTT